MNPLKAVAAFWRKASAFSNQYPISRGMASYSFIWPTGSLIQQTIEGKEEYDLWRVLRFSFYGSCYVAPTLTAWLTIARYMFPKNNLPSALAKALIEQVSYTPFAIASFYCGMTLLEGRGLETAFKEVQEKFFPTYQVAVVVWPVLQTINYTLVAEKNRVVYVSVCSLMWTSFLAYMKHLQGSHFKELHSHAIHTVDHDPQTKKYRDSKNLTPILSRT